MVQHPYLMTKLYLDIFKLIKPWIKMAVYYSKIKLTHFFFFYIIDASTGSLAATVLAA